MLKTKIQYQLPTPTFKRMAYFTINKSMLKYSIYLKMHDVRSFKVCKRMFGLIFAVSDLVPKLWTLKRSNEGSITVGNWNATRFQKFLGSVKTFGTQFVIPKATKEFRNKDVSVIFGGRVPISHVGADHLDFVSP